MNTLGLLEYFGTRYEDLLANLCLNVDTVSPPLTHSINSFHNEFHILINELKSIEYTAIINGENNHAFLLRTLFGHDIDLKYRSPYVWIDYPFESCTEKGLCINHLHRLINPHSSQTDNVDPQPVGDDEKEKLIQLYHNIVLLNRYHKANDIKTDGDFYNFVNSNHAAITVSYARTIKLKNDTLPVNSFSPEDVNVFETTISLNYKINKTGFQFYTKSEIVYTPDRIQIPLKLFTPLSVIKHEIYNFIERPSTPKDRYILKCMDKNPPYTFNTKLFYDWALGRIDSTDITGNRDYVIAAEVIPIKTEEHDDVLETTVIFNPDKIYARVVIGDEGINIESESLVVEYVHSRFGRHKRTYSLKHDEPIPISVIALVLRQLNHKGVKLIDTPLVSIDDNT